MEHCARCGRNEEEIRLFDGIYVNDTVKVCERCSLISGIPIIKRPSVEQLKDSEKPYGVRARLSRMAHLNEEQKKEQSVIDEIKKLEKTPELEKPSDNDLVFKLVDNFHWQIQTARRRKCLSQGQLAESLGCGVSAVTMLEKGIIPRDSLNLIVSLEQFLNIKLVKNDMIEELEAKRKSEERMMRMRESGDMRSVSGMGEIKGVSEVKKEPEHLGVKRHETESMSLRELQKLNERVERDFEFGAKSREQVGNEQLEGFGREDMRDVKKSLMPAIKRRGDVPSIHDLMRMKEERDKSLMGADIEVVEEKSFGIKKAKWDDLE